MRNKFQVSNHAAIVTGGAGRLGPSFAEALLETGAHVVLADRDSTRSRQVLVGLEKKFGPKIVFHPVDVTDAGSIERLVSFTVKRWGGVSVLLNAAMSVGKDFYAPLESYTWTDWQNVMNVNVGGVFLCTQKILKVMKRQKYGVIINIGSIYGMVGADWRIYGKSGINSPAVYAASKGAVINLTRYFAVHLARYGVRVNCISPGGVFDGQEAEFVRHYSARTPMGRMLDRKELKGAVKFLASNESSYVTGHNLVVDGGWTAW